MRQQSKFHRYFNLERRVKRGIVKGAIHNITKLINARRQTLLWYAQFLTDPFECEQVYNYRTVYERGPMYQAELQRLLAIRRDLWAYYAGL